MSEICITMTKDLRIKSRDGDKTNMRRLIKPQPEYIHRNSKTNFNLLNSHDNIAVVEYSPIFFSRWLETEYVYHLNGEAGILELPYKVGDILLVQEPYQITGSQCTQHKMRGVYIDDGSPFTKSLTNHEWNLWDKRKKPYMKTSSRFMYKSLVRDRYRVTGVGVELLQDISEEDAIAEGIEELGERKFHGKFWKMVYKSYDKDITCCSAVAAFETLWDSIYPEHGWSKNEYIVKLTYERIL